MNTCIVHLLIKNPLTRTPQTNLPHNHNKLNNRPPHKTTTNKTNKQLLTDGGGTKLKLTKPNLPTHKRPRQLGNKTCQLPHLLTNGNHCGNNKTKSKHNKHKSRKTTK